MSTFMAKEIKEIPNVIEAQHEANAPQLIELSEYLKKTDPWHIVTLGRGSSYNASNYAKYIFEESLGVPVTVAAPSLASIYDKGLKLKNSLLIVTSQSGKSPDLIKFLQKIRAGGTKAVGIINDTDSPLAKECDFLLSINAGEEKSVAATKSYIGSLSAFASILATWSENNELAEALLNLPAYLDQTLQMTDWPYFIESLQDCVETFSIGRGVGLSSALESALKLKETCQIHAEGISATEIFHGSVSLLKENYPVISFVGNDESRTSSLEINKKLTSYGANVLAFDTKGKSDNTLVLPEVHPILQPLVHMTAYYKLVEELSLHRGFNPDTPPNLKKVTETL